MTPFIASRDVVPARPWNSGCGALTAAITVSHADFNRRQAAPPTSPTAMIICTVPCNDSIGENRSPPWRGKCSLSVADKLKVFDQIIAV